MGTVIRPEISVKNRYWLPKHRYYELYHFCLQYPEWKKNYLSLDGYASKSASIVEQNGQHEATNPTAVYAEARLYYRERMEMIENAAKEAAADLYLPMLRAVPECIYRGFCPEFHSCGYTDTPEYAAALAEYRKKEC